VGVSSVQFSSSLQSGDGVVLYRCESRLGMACVHSMECRDNGAACRGVGTVWLGGRVDEDKLGVCMCDNQHMFMLGGCKKVTRRVGEPCSSSKQCQKVKAICRQKKAGIGTWSACPGNRFEDKTGKISYSLLIVLVTLLGNLYFTVCR
jgi:hypothetical protein